MTDNRSFSGGGKFGLALSIVYISLATKNRTPSVISLQIFSVISSAATICGDLFMFRPKNRFFYLEV